MKEGKPEAAQRLWERYSTKLVEAASRRLGGRPKRLADEEDIAASVFHSVCRGAAAGRFQKITNRDELWWLLLAITKQKVVNYSRYEFAEKRTPKARCEILTLDNLVSNEPTPDFLVELDEQYRHLLSILSDNRSRQIATARVEGYTVPEIAALVQISTRSVERKLKVIRSKWSAELAQLDYAD